MEVDLLLMCASNCPTKDHRNWGECVRSKRVSTKAGETTKASFPAPKPKE